MFKAETVRTLLVTRSVSLSFVDMSAFSATAEPAALVIHGGEERARGVKVGRRKRGPRDASPTEGVVLASNLVRVAVPVRNVRKRE